MSAAASRIDAPAACADSAATRVDAPLRIAGEGAIGWDDSCDVLVAGFGAAGASAAIEAARAGARVVAADRFGGGGASAKSGGVVYAGGGTRFQKAAGYEDTPEAMYEYLSKEVGDAVSPATLRSFCDHSVALLEWLEQNGVEFDSSLPPRKTGAISISRVTRPSRNTRAHTGPRRAAIGSRAPDCPVPCCIGRCATARCGRVCAC